MKPRYLLGIFIACLLGLVYLYATPITLSSVDWDNPVPFTNDTLNCSWTHSGVEAMNITIYRDGSVWNTTWLNQSAGDTLRDFTIVDSQNTSKGEIWLCNVTVYNSTASSSNDFDSVTIKNSPPTTEGADAGIFNSTGDIGFSTSMREDLSITIDVNASDNDGDTLTYLTEDYSNSSLDFCDIQSSATGVYICEPAQADIQNNANTVVNITFTVTDGQNVGGRTVTVTLIPYNDAPNISVSNQTTPVNTSLNYTFSITDEESQRMTVELIFNSSNNEIQDKISAQGLNSDNSSFSIYYDASTPDFNDIGIWPIWVNATDNESRNNVSVYYLNLSAVGRNPYFLNFSPNNGPYNLTEDVAFQINITANDSDVNQTIVFFDDTNNFDIVTLDNTTNTSAATGQINYTPTNDHVGSFSVVVTIRDETGLENTTTLTFNVTNVNDPPEIYENSSYATNTQNNTNASNLTAYANTPFSYRVNATDIDVGDSIFFRDNSSLFVINSSTGEISFSPTSGQVSGTPYTVNISVNDTSDVVVNRTIVLWILGNTPPRFNVTPPVTLNATADTLFTFDLNNWVTDSESSVSNFTVLFNSSTLANFAYDTTSGVINFTPNKSEVGNYSFTLRIADILGAHNSTQINLTVNNTPVSPNLIRFNFSTETIVETKPTAYELRANDTDFLVPTISEVVNFSTNMSINYSITPITTTGSVASALLVLTPDIGDAGTYDVWINATDSFGNFDTEIVTFTVLSKVDPPNITNVTPFGRPPGFALEETFNSTEFFPNNQTNVTFSENRNVTFAVRYTDPQPNNYSWSYDGSNFSAAENVTYEFNYTSSGRHWMILNISNDRREFSLFTWNLTIANVNRNPLLLNSLPNRTVNRSLSTSFYFIYGGAGVTRFIDPDDDVNSNNQTYNGTGFEPGELNTLSFSRVGACDVASISISGSNISIVGTDIGTCTVRFNATDQDGAKLQSNNVTINITEVEEGTEETQTTVSTGGGGGTSSRNNYIPILRQDVKPEAFNLIAPRLVTIYDNNSINIPITINNTWRSALQFLQLSVNANDSDLEAHFDQDLFEEIPKNQSRDVILTVENYRLGENYELIVTGNVSDPDYTDDAIIILSSIEQTSEGDQVNVKVTFANDLLNSHPECQELNEVLNQAKTELSAHNIARARQLVDGVIDGCKYLVQTHQRVSERPYRINPVIDLANITTLAAMISIMVFIVLLSIAMLIYYHYSRGSDEDI